MFEDRRSGLLQHGFVDFAARALRRRGDEPPRTGQRARRGRSRGVTLVEVLIVVAIMSVIAGGATILVFPLYKESRIKVAVIGCNTVKEAAELYQNLDAISDECPTVQDLVAARKLDPKKLDDPWGVPYAIRCESGDVHVVSAGNDRKEGTADDLRDDFRAADIKRVKER
jgi:general secretion pathway protein G